MIPPWAGSVYTLTSLPQARLGDPAWTDIDMDWREKTKTISSSAFSF